MYFYTDESMFNKHKGNMHKNFSSINSSELKRIKLRIPSNT